MSVVPSQARDRRGGDAPAKQAEGREHQARAWGRRLAEALTLTMSALLILTLAGYLLLQALHPDTPYVAAEARLLLAETRQQADRYILPVEIVNSGRRTLREVTVEITYTGAEGGRETREITIDYLGERSRQRAYLYFDRHPRDLDVQARPVQYRLD